MGLLRRLIAEQKGQGIVEYTLMVALVALVIWIAVKTTNMDEALQTVYNNVKAQLNAS